MYLHLQKNNTSLLKDNKSELCIYTSSQTFLNSKICIFLFIIIFCSPSLHLFDPNYCKKQFTI